MYRLGAGNIIGAGAIIEASSRRPSESAENIENVGINLG
jgi:hypothetical protein